MHKGDNQFIPPISKPVQQPQSSLLEMNLIRHVKDKDWPAKKKLLDNPWL